MTYSKEQASAVHFLIRRLDMGLRMSWREEDILLRGHVQKHERPRISPVFER